MASDGVLGVCIPESIQFSYTSIHASPFTVNNTLADYTLLLDDKQPEIHCLISFSSFEKTANPTTTIPVITMQSSL